MRKLLLAGLALPMMTGAVAAADEPRISGELVLELQSDTAYKSDAAANELTNTTAKVELGTSINLGQGFAINSMIVAEQINGPAKDAFLSEHGAFFQELNLSYATDSFEVMAGKFNPNFSIGFDIVPGVFGDTFAADNEITEMVGFGGAYNINDSMTLSGSAFFADTSFLSESFGTNRGRTRQSAGGPANTGAPESFAVALDGSDIPGVEGLSYHVGFVRLADDNNDDELRLAAAGEYAFEINEDLTLTPMAEYVRVWNSGGNGNDDRNYIILGAALDYRNWQFSTAYSGRFIENTGAADVNDHFYTAAIAYAFDFGLEASVAWNHTEDANVDTQTFGLFLGYTHEF